MKTLGQSNPIPPEKTPDCKLACMGFFKSSFTVLSA